MAGLEADTSSYLKPGSLKSAVDYAKDYTSLDLQQQQLQSNKLGIDSQKLDNANKALTFMTRALGSIGPNATPEQYHAVGADAVKLGLAPPETLHVWDDKVKSYIGPDGKFNSEGLYNEAMTAAASHEQQIAIHRGQTQLINRGPDAVPVTIKPGQAPVQIGQPIRQGLPVGTNYSDPNNQDRLSGSAPLSNDLYGAQGQPQPAPQPSLRGAVAPPPPAAQNAPALPVAAPISGPTGPTVRRPDLEGSNPTGDLKSKPSPMFAAGQEMLAKDRMAATSTSTALKPLEEAYDLAKNVSTGAGTETLNKARAYLTNAGLIKADEKNPTVIYQMLNKNLAGFVDQNGTRSDADLAVKESSNANAKTQLQPALLHMVQKIIGRKRIEIARPGAFEDQNVANYSQHSADFPTSQDERAYTLDKMPTDEARSLYLDMKNKAINGKGAEKEEGIKFIKSLATARKTGQVGGIN